MMMMLRLRPLLIAAALLSASPSALAQSSTRQEFVDRISQLRLGMHIDEVREILGEPDDIRRRSDPHAVRTARTREIWVYGTNGRLTFPTLGQVYIDYNNQVQYIYGGRDLPHITYFIIRPKQEPPGPELFTEDELRELLRALHGACQGGYNPLDMIRIVNRLQPLGKDNALAVIDEYLRVSSEHDLSRQRTMYILRVLFLTPEMVDELPIVGLPGEREYRAQFPLFPIVIHRDIPLFLNPISNPGVAGGLPNPLKHVEFYREHGVIRGQPLRPPDNPLRVLDELVALPEWVFKRDAHWEDEHQTARWGAARQLLELVDTVYRVEIANRQQRLKWRDDFDARWREIREAFDELDVRWDDEQQQYVFGDGTTLPPLHEQP